MLARSAAFSLILLLTAGAPAALAAQSAPETAGCTLHAGTYTCDWTAFRNALNSAHTVTVESQHIDRWTESRLRHLAQKLGKTVVAPGQPADLTFLLIPIESTGVEFGPGTHDLATLRIYAPGPNTTRGTLLWAETYRGDPERPWPATVDSTIQQFQDRLSKP